MENSYVRSQNSFISKTMLTMGLGLLVTFIIAFAAPLFLPRISGPMYFGAAIVELGIVIYLTRRIEKLSVASARIWFFVYSIINGLTMSLILSAYVSSTVLLAFLFASLMFFASSMIGITIKKDLSTFGRVLYMALIGLIIVSIFQIFFPMPGLYFGISLFGVLIFCGLTAYDMQVIKNFHNSSYSYDPNSASKFVILAALALYLDFINIFLFLLRLFGNDD